MNMMDLILYDEMCQKIEDPCNSVNHCFALGTGKRAIQNTKWVNRF